MAMDSTSSPAAQGTDHQGRREHRAARDRRSTAQASRRVRSRRGRYTRTNTTGRRSSPASCSSRRGTLGGSLREHCVRELGPYKSPKISLRRRPAQGSFGQGPAPQVARPLDPSAAALVNRIEPLQSDFLQRKGRAKRGVDPERDHRACLRRQAAASVVPDDRIASPGASARCRLCDPRRIFAGTVRGFGGFGLSAFLVAGLSLWLSPQSIVPAAMMLEILASVSLLRSVWPTCHGIGFGR